MLYNQKIKIKWNNASKKYYIKLGYQFTKINDEFYVNVKDLQLASSAKVKVKCDYCGKDYFTTYKSYNRHIKSDKIEKDCCKDCVKFKREDTLLDKYGVKSASQSDVIRKKIKRTMLEKYGVENPSQVQEFQDKKKQTFSKKYNADSFVESEKFKKILQEKYNVENPMQYSEFRHKASQTLQNNGNVKVSKSEIKLCKLLSDMYGEENCFPSYVHDRYILDCMLILNEIKIDIEFDGVYWHNLRDKNHDKERDNKLKKDGYKIFRILSKNKLPTKEQIEVGIQYLINNKNKYYHIKVQ